MQLANLVVDRDIQRAVKFAEQSNRLDLSWMGLDEFPIWIVKRLRNLQVLTLAGNSIKQLPDPLAYVTSLRTLLVTGNKLVRNFPPIVKLTAHLRCSAFGAWPAGKSAQARGVGLGQ